MPNNINPTYRYDGLEVTPSPRLPYDVQQYLFWQRFFRQRYESKIERKYPEFWGDHQIRAYKNAMFYDGMGEIHRNNKFGTIFTGAIMGGAGVDIWNMELGVTLKDTLLIPSKPLIVNKNCAVIRSMPDVGYGGLGDGLFALGGVYQVVKYYAAKVALSFQAHDVNIMNSQVAYVFACQNSNDAESFSKLASEVYAGNGAVFVAKKLYDKNGNLMVSQFNNDVGKNYLADKLIADVEQIICEFDSFVGIENANTKVGNQGGISDMQIASNNEETQTLIDYWIDTENESIDNAIKLYPELKGLSVKKKEHRQNVEEGGEKDDVER